MMKKNCPAEMPGRNSIVHLHLKRTFLIPSQVSSLISFSGIPSSIFLRCLLRFFSDIFSGIIPRYLSQVSFSGIFPGIFFRYLLRYLFQVSSPVFFSGIFSGIFVTLLCAAGWEAVFLTCGPARDCASFSACAVPFFTSSGNAFSTWSINGI